MRGTWSAAIFLLLLVPVTVQEVVLVIVDLHPQMIFRDMGALRQQTIVVKEVNYFGKVKLNWLNLVMKCRDLSMWFVSLSSITCQFHQPTCFSDQTMSWCLSLTSVYLSPTS